ncbi:LysM peptidoglycan-binding domain-containing protein [Geminisphaera colitermitum]|uniref:LysM peptidoglycan-binding domain-containing protein n=1 Tax=Geminisphaera colitermitum TaxID=1148786 RepID=UPI0001965061|nr:LysM domain-containing protein [Geminisphaera colitermitum]
MKILGPILLLLCVGCAHETGTKDDSPEHYILKQPTIILKNGKKVRMTQFVTFYTVQTNDTANVVSAKCNMPIERLKALNYQLDFDRLKAGQIIALQSPEALILKERIEIDSPVVEANHKQ